MTGYLPVGFEFGAELTFPEPEGTSSGLLNASAQTFGICFTLFYSELFTAFGDNAANTTMATMMLIVGTIITAATRSDLRRQNAQAGSAAGNPLTHYTTLPGNTSHSHYPPQHPPQLRDRSCRLFLCILRVVYAYQLFNILIYFIVYCTLLL
ncbi:feline leukemia virus subgroup C receptor-related protein 1-like [Drosophila miranda]|uniref:feline leukemia virus subgroup C receptor-related protein 1-like n=1 Tax=Drosophila miranda TaxID=7229 RepID=UPI00143F08A6|nr:feline leukemia virus subgroup C receptor-related protein 1-like [Drosophila miranda]